MKNIVYVKNRKSPWCVCTTIAGEKRRKFFARESDAKEYLRDFRRKIRDNGINALFFSASERTDYEESLALAKSHGYDRILALLAALINNTKTPQPQQPHPQSAPQPRKISIPDAAFQYYEEKERVGRRRETLRDIRNRVMRFADRFAAQPFASLTQKQIEDWCLDGKSSPRTRRNNFCAVLSFLRWAKRRGYHSLPLDFDRTAFLPRELKKQKTVFSLQEVREFLNLLQEEPIFRRFIPFFALQLFCGIRRAEAERIRWDWIDIEKKQILLPAEITKTGEEHILRPPFLPETVFAWLAPFRPSLNSSEKIPVPTSVQRERISHRFGKWQHNGSRHTFATMHVSLHGDPAKTAVILRHRNQQRLWQNYLARLVPEDDARAYFALAPSAALLDSVKTERTPQ